MPGRCNWDICPVEISLLEKVTFLSLDCKTVSAWEQLFFYKLIALQFITRISVVPPTLYMFPVYGKPRQYFLQFYPEVNITISAST